MNYLIYQILKLREFLLASGLAGMIMMILFLLWAVRPKKGIVQYGGQGLFFGQRMRDILYINGAALQLIFALSSLVGKVSIDRIHMVLLAAVCLLKLLAKPQILWMIADAGYSMLLLALLLVGNMLDGFIWQTRADMWARMMYYLLCIFIAEFSVYYFFKQLQNLLNKQQRQRQKESDIRG